MDLSCFEGTHPSRLAEARRTIQVGPQIILRQVPNQPLSEFRAMVSFQNHVSEALASRPRYFFRAKPSGRGGGVLR